MIKELVTQGPRSTPPCCNQLFSGGGEHLLERRLELFICALELLHLHAVLFLFRRASSAAAWSGKGQGLRLSSATSSSNRVLRSEKESDRERASGSDAVG